MGTMISGYLVAYWLHWSGENADQLGDRCLTPEYDDVV